nr:unnamed protein product [Callosobruchus chinensis]
MSINRSKTKKNTSTKVSDEPVANSNMESELNNVLSQLAAGMIGLQKSFEGLSMLVKEKGDNKKPHCSNESPDSSFIYIWKELGGNHNVFSPGGRTHPQAFIKKLKKLFFGAGVPENHRVGLAISGLRGTAADWASIKEDSFPTFTDFEHAFIERYWGMAKQRDLFLNLSYGRHESGSLSKYFMNLVNQANFLTERILEEKLTKMLSKHFPSEIQRGIVTMGLKTIDEIDEYLREVDDVRREAPVGQGNNSRENTNGKNRRQNNECVGYTNAGSRGQVMSRLTTFNDENDFLSSESESEEVSEQSKFKSPILRAKVGSVQSDIIVDSGSEVSAVSEKFFDGIKQYVKVPVLPVSGLAISPAFGAKRQRIKWQILLSIQLLSHQNIDLDVKCLVIPGLNCDILFGCDWLASFKASIDFQSSKASFSYGDEAFTIPFHSEVDTDGQLSVNLCSSSSDILEEAGVGKNSVLSLHPYSNAEFKIATNNADTDEVSRNRLENVLLQYSGVFSENPGCVKSYVHRVEMEDESPFNAPLYPIPFIYREEVKNQVREVERWGGDRETENMLYIPTSGG